MVTIPNGEETKQKKSERIQRDSHSTMMMMLHVDDLHIKTINNNVRNM